MHETLQDKLDWQTIDQLHNATLQISKQSFEIKKLCVVVLVSVLTLILKLLENQLDLSLFFISVIIISIFYFLDCLTYYYQDKLRGLMITTENKIRERYEVELRENKHEGETRLFRTVINLSHSIYLILLMLDIVFLCLFLIKWIE